MAAPYVPDLHAVGLAWARVLPTVTLVPAFGLRALPLPARGTIALALAAALLPAVPSWQLPGGFEARQDWVLFALGQVVLGLPTALAAALPLWAATMAGGLVDVLRGATPEDSTSVVVEGRVSAVATLLSLLASVVFLASGGASRVVLLLGAPSPSEHPLVAVSQGLVAGITLAVAIGGPLLAAAVMLEVALALVARAATPAQVHALLAPLRSLGILAILALVLERIGTLLARSML